MTKFNYELRFKLRLNKLAKFIKDKNISRAQIIVFLKRKNQTVKKSETTEELIERLNEFSHDVLFSKLPKIKAHIKQKQAVVKNDELIAKHKKIDDMFKKKTYFKVLATHEQKAFFNKIEKIHSVVNTRYTLSPIPFTVTRANLITDGCEELLEKSKAKAQAKHVGGFNIFLKLILSDIVFDSNNEKPTQYASVVIKGNNITRKDIYDKVFIQASKMYNTPNYCLTLHAVDVVISPLAVAGGCNPNKIYKSEKIQKSKHEKIILKSLPSSNNNCIFACINHFYGAKGNSLKPSMIRKELSLPPDEKIHYKIIPHIIDYYNKKYDKNYGYHVVNELNQSILFKDGDRSVNIYLRGEHYHIWESVNFKKCKTCGRVLKNENTDHKCSQSRTTYYNKKVKTNNQSKIVLKSEIADDNKIDYNNLVYWDTETFQETNRHVVYASGWSVGGEYKVEYGKDSLTKTIDDFEKMENKIITAYNGSGFDFYFLIDKLTERNIKIENIILSNGKVMSFTFGKNNKVIDLFLFIMSSLDTACKDFKIKNAKSSFDHNKMKSWNDVEQYQGEVLPYLKLDVLALKELFETFNDMIYELFQTNITKYVTASHMGYELWRNKLDDIVEIPDNLEKYDFIKRATFGGRCYPMQQEFRSKYYDDIVSGKMKYDDLQKTDEFIFNADVTSLYPASMKGNKLVNVFYPTGTSRWSSKPKEEYDNHKIGFYEISYIPPRNILVPILPKKKYVNNTLVGIEWDLFPGEGVFTSVDIENAISSGYNVEFINKCLVYDNQSSNVFGVYVDTFYQLKETAEREENDVKRSVAKLMLNSLYGKTLQKAIFNTTTIINDVFEFNKFVLEHELTDYSILNENKMIVSGTALLKEEMIRKPCQLGAFVTAYSRKLMLYFMKVIDPSLKSLIFTYTDTDSLHIKADGYRKLLEKGLIVPKSESKLGYMCSDIKDDGYIIYEKNLAPKTYCYEYLTSKGKLAISDLCTMKAKGIPKKCLDRKFYSDSQGHVVEFNGLQKVHKKITNNQKNQGVSHFSIINNHQKRTFNKTSWSGFDLVNGQFRPKNYQA